MTVFRWFKLAKRVSELEEQMLKLTRIVEDRDLDWVDMRARVKRMLDRTEKAANRVGSVEEPTQTEEPGAGGAGPSTGFLSPRQHQLQMQILKRRAGGA